MTPITGNTEFKPSGKLPEKKGPVDEALDKTRKKFQEGLKKASKTKEHNDKISRDRDAYGENENNNSLETILGNAYTVASPVIRYHNVENTNKKVLDKSLKGIRDKYNNAQKSMPISKP